MARYVFLGPYETNVELPDGSVILVNPGDVAELDFDDPGPLWGPDAGADALKGAALTKALTDARLPKTGTADEKRAALAALSVAAPTDPAPPAPTEPAPASGATPADTSTTNTAAPPDTPPTDPATGTPEENK